MRPSVPNSRIIKITQEGVYLTSDYIISWDQTNLPPGAFSIKSKLTIFWEVSGRLLSEGQIWLEVIDYNPDRIHAFRTQKMTGTVSYIEFGLLDWIEFEKLLSNYIQKDLLPFMLMEEKQLPNEQAQWNKLSTPPPQVTQILSGELISHNETIHADYEDIYFGNGYAEYSWFYSETNAYLDLRIPNPFLFSGLNLIKEFIIRIQKKSYAIFRLQLSIRHAQIEDYQVESSDITNIGVRFFDRIKMVLLESLSEKPKMPLKKDLITLEDLDDMYFIGPDPINIDQILAYWLEKPNVRNKQQLIYLSQIFQCVTQKIYLTHDPAFGFIFTHSGKQMWHFCWELPDSNASYLWSFPKEAYDTVRCKEEISLAIAMIKQYGRNFYKSTFNTSSHDYLFHAIHHESHSLIQPSHFHQWQSRLEGKLI